MARRASMRGAGSMQEWMAMVQEKEAAKEAKAAQAASPEDSSGENEVGGRSKAMELKALLQTEADDWVDQQMGSESEESDAFASSRGSEGPRPQSRSTCRRSSASQDALSSAGILADFIDRGKAKHGQSHMPGFAWFMSELLQTGIYHGESLEMIKGACLFEQLTDKLMFAVTLESKERRIYPRTPPSAFRRQALAILHLKKTKIVLNVEVSNWTLRQRLLTNPTLPYSEDREERRNRHEEFYSTFKPKRDGRTEHEDGDEGPRYKMKFGIGPSLRWSVDKPAGTLLHQNFQREGLLTLDGRPEDPDGDGRFPPVLDEFDLFFEEASDRPTSGMTRPDSAMTRPSTSMTRPPSGMLRPLSAYGSAVSSASFSVLQPIRAGKKSYFQECSKHGSIPVPTNFMTGHSMRMRGHGHLFTDAEILSLKGMLQSRTNPMQELDLNGNALLSDRSLVPLLKELCDDGLRLDLEVLKLGKCSRAGYRTILASIDLVKSAIGLKHLDLSGMNVGTQNQVSLCLAIGKHSNLEIVSLSNTGLGSSECITLDCLDHLFANPHLRKVDLGWNRFNHADFRLMGELCCVSKVEELCVDSSAAYVIGLDSPVAELMERMMGDNTLRRLSLASNRIDFKVALVIEDALDRHPQLRYLDMSENPLGALGIRSLLRLLSRKSNSLIMFDSEGCYQGVGMDHSDTDSCQVFSFTNPGARYKLDLERPYPRSLLRMLYKRADQCGASFEEAFMDVKYSQPPYQHPEQVNGVWQVAQTGRLGFIFSIESVITREISGIDDADFLGFLDKHFEATRFKADWNKITPLFGKWKDLDGREIDQGVFIEALAKDFNMTLAYLSYLCESSPGNLHRTMVTMFPTVPSDMQSRYLAMMFFPKIADVFFVYGQMEKLLLFNANNPTGHYKLNLANSCDFAVAQRLILLDRWESVVNRRHDRVDVTQRNNRSHLRNEYHQGRALHLRVKSVAEWSLPEQDIFECDYMSSFRPPPGSQTLSSSLWERLMVTMYRSTCRQCDKIKALRNISHNIFITSMHMRQMVGYFRESIDREEAFVTFYLRIVDMHNQKQFKVRFDAEDELERLQTRLNYTSFFPFIQPENARFTLNFKFHDQRLCSSIIVDMAYKEKLGGGNIKNPVFILPDGTIDDLAMGVPRSWADEKNLPPAGIFKCTYVCSPEDRQISLRKSMAAKYGYMNTDFTDEDINWWTGLNEAGDDVLSLLEFFISRYSNVDEAFREIDGGVGEGGGNTTSNGEITLREFEAGLKDIGCKKFKGKDEMERIANVFRYLDPGGEGSVSLSEWQILDQLWKEFVLSIQEFVQFLIYVFGEDLENAWNQLDDDGSGEMNEQEFFEAVQTIGYFGPARVVFALLDGSDDGNISYDEFIVLEKYRPKPLSRQG